MKFLLTVMTCRGREASLADTVASLAQTDWASAPRIVADPGNDPDPKRSQTMTARKLLSDSLQAEWDYLLFCEDDVRFNRHLAHNLTAWLAVPVLVGSLYGSGPETAVPIDLLGGSQGIVISRGWLPTVLDRWESFHPSLMQDLRIYRSLRGTAETVPIHTPNLIQHSPVASTWGGPAHQSATFDRHWKA